ncbi:MAG: hypothetical protein LBD21_02955 [Tannerellaceae bacterium]|nr:hypothetical protein [Tannerellaceae bacterium]
MKKSSTMHISPKMNVDYHTVASCGGMNSLQKFWTAALHPARASKNFGRLRCTRREFPKILDGCAAPGASFQKFWTAALHPVHVSKNFGRLRCYL